MLSGERGERGESTHASPSGLEVQPVPMRIERRDEFLNPGRRRQRRHSDDWSVTGTNGTQSRRQIPPRAHRGIAHVRLGHDEDVGHLHDPRLQELQRVAGARLHDNGDRVAQLRDISLGLPDANRLDNHDVEGGSERLSRIPGRLGEPTEPRAGSRGPDHDPVVLRVVLDPHPVAQE